MVRVCASILFSAVSFLAIQSAAAVTIETVPVGNAGNANDPFTGNLYGGVSYYYRIGTYEVTNTQYAAFLNAKAAEDPLELYNTSMGSDAVGGITRSGSGTLGDPYTYATKPNMGDKPVNYTNWYDAIRFTNWLHNGQGTGDTETGAYTLEGGTPTPSNGNSITREPGAMWFLTRESEWYKAAYYQPAALGGDSDNYWQYPTASNSVPTVATAIDVVGPTRGDISNPGSNVANFEFGADWNSQNGNVTTVGSAGPLSESYYGTSDQGGNVFEWLEDLPGSGRIIRGGGWEQGADYLRSPIRNVGADPTSNSNSYFGFRVAAIDGVASTGNNVSTTVDGGSTNVGGVDATFDNVTGVGALTSDFFTPASFDEAITNLGLLNGDVIGFLLAGISPQYWDLDFTGTFTGNVTVTLNYDPVLLGDADLTALQVYHGHNGTWSAVSNLVVNPTNHTLTFTADSFSPFVLGIPVPEPSTYVLALTALLATLGIARARSRHR